MNDQNIPSRSPRSRRECPRFVEIKPSPASRLGCAFAGTDALGSIRSSESLGSAAALDLESAIFPVGAGRATERSLGDIDDRARAASAGLWAKESERRSETARGVSVFSCARVWLIPLLSEGTLLLGALWWSTCLHRVIWTPGAGFPILSMSLLAILYGGLAYHARAHELFMPRIVVTVGVGCMGLLALGVGAGIAVDAYLLGGARRLLAACLVVIPLALFAARSVAVCRAARFAPPTRELGFRVHARAAERRIWRSWLRFWIS